MLIEIAKVLGGMVKTINNAEYVIWTVNEKKKIENIIKIYDIYPPLTSKKICELAFLKQCLNTTEFSVKTFLSIRNLKYNNQLSIIKSNINFNIPFYFKEWLSGFIEAKGQFIVKESNNRYFLIGQNYDIYLINAIKKYFNISNKINNTHDKFYFLKIYKKETLLKIITHCTNYPLIGDKLEKLRIFNTSQ
jgi:hypothetical protein